MCTEYNRKSLKISLLQLHNPYGTDNGEHGPNDRRRKSWSSVIILCLFAEITEYLPFCSRGGHHRVLRNRKRHSASTSSSFHVRRQAKHIYYWRRRRKKNDDIDVETWTQRHSKIWNYECQIWNIVTAVIRKEPYVTAAFLIQTLSEWQSQRNQIPKRTCVISYASA